MKVSIATACKIHSVYLAKELEKRRVDYRLYNTHPVFSPDVKRQHVKTNYLVLGTNTAFNFVPAIRDRLRWNSFKDIYFDQVTGRKISRWNPDIHHGFACYSYDTFDRLKKNNPNTRLVLDRASPHMRFKQNLLAREFKKMKVPFIPEPEFSVKRQLAEYEKAEKILILSSFVRNSFVSSGVDEEKLVQVPYGVKYPAEVPEKKDDVFRVLCVGGYAYRKGVPYLIQAFSELNLENSELLLVGRIKHEVQPFIDKYVQKGANIRLIARIPHEEIGATYANASVYCMPSISDGWGLVVTEAMSYGVPPVVSENTGAKDAISSGKSGFVIPTGDVKAIKAKLQYFYDNPQEIRRMGQRARAVAKKYNWDLYGDRIHSFYKKMM